MDSHEQEGCALKPSLTKLTAIKELNDRLRRDHRDGRLFVTSGICRLRQGAMDAIIAAVASFDAFSPDNDPHGEHDFGALTVGGERVLWKIDCYDRRMEYASPDAADPNMTTRVLTIMLASKY